MEKLKHIYNSAKFHYEITRADYLQKYYSPRRTSPTLQSRSRESRLFSLRNSGDGPEQETQQHAEQKSTNKFLQAAQEKVDQLRNIEGELRKTLVGIDFDEIIKQKCSCECHEPATPHSSETHKTSIGRLKSFSFKKKHNATEVPFIPSPVMETDSASAHHTVSQASSEENHQPPKSSRRLSVGSIVNTLVARPEKADISQSNPKVWKTVINEVSLSAAKITTGSNIKRSPSNFSNLSADFTSQSSIQDYHPRNANSNYEIDLIALYN